VTRTAPRHGAAPAFLVGLALALGTQVGAGLLLYGGPGFLPALSVVLATAAVSLALGLDSGAGVLRLRSPVEAARRGWLLLLLAFTGAAFFSAGWEIFRGFGARSLAQGLGLALMVALPLYLGGRLLSILDLRHAGTRPPGAPALTGAAVGFLLLAHLFFPTLSPTAVLLLCVVSVSGGALAHGWVLDEVLFQEVSPVADGDLLIRRTRRTRPPLDRLAVEEPPRVHLLRRGDGAPLLAVDLALETELLPSLPVPERVLALGWRAIPATVRSIPAAVKIVLHHPDPDRVRALLPLLAGPSGEVSPHLEVVSDPGQEPADWILVDAGALEDPRNPPWPRLRQLLRPGGTLVLVGAREGDDGQGLLHPLRAGGPHFGGAAAYIGATGGPPEDDADPAPGDPPSPPRREGLLVFSEAGRAEWPERLGALLLVLPEGEVP
jgi:hypothetical protein